MTPSDAPTDPEDAFPLLTERLILRLFTLEDAPTLQAYRTDPEVARYQSWDAPYSLEEAQDLIRETTSVPPGTPGTYCQLALELRETGEVIGDVVFSLRRRPRLQEGRLAEIGFTLRQEHQGHGFAQEAVTRLLQSLFQDWDVHRVQAQCDVRNDRSSRLMERVGMRREACFLEAAWWKGEWTSEYVYALLRREWETR